MTAYLVDIENRWWSGLIRIAANDLRTLGPISSNPKLYWDQLRLKHNKHQLH